MVNTVVCVAFSLQKPLMHLSLDFIESCYSWSQHKSFVWQVVQLAQPFINLEPHVCYSCAHHMKLDQDT